MCQRKRKKNDNKETVHYPFNYCQAMPLEKRFRQLAGDILCLSKATKYFWVIASQLIPAFLTDLGLRVTGNNPW